MRLRDALRHDPGGPSFAGLEPDATPKAPGGKRRTLAKLEERGVELADLQERLYAEATQPGATRGCSSSFRAWTPPARAARSSTSSGS